MGYDVPMENFYPRPPRGGRPRALFPLRQGLAISIHALREEGDLEELRESVKKIMISIHALREEGDPVHHRHHSTHRCISIHALREEGDAPPSKNGQTGGYFYPRPPRGGRQLRKPQWIGVAKFLSTPSARRATNLTTIRSRLFLISIHALREEGDDFDAFATLSTVYFYPRPPRGGRPGQSGLMLLSKKFLSTPSARRATQHDFHVWRIHDISIHALREEGDLITLMGLWAIKQFLSTPSARRATKQFAQLVLDVAISIHALREEGDQ